MYRSPHWQEPNVLAHIRMNDRKDADGNNVLFIEELQSDWAQAGRKGGIQGELTAEETQWVRKASRDLPIDLIWITSDEIPGLGRGSHSFWYSHPWVSTDVLVQLLFNARPAERGLGVYEEEGTARIWHFPPDYPQRASEAIDRLKVQRKLGPPQP